MRRLIHLSFLLGASTSLLLANEAADLKQIKEQGSPKVLRCVLDSFPRALVIQLEDNHAIAYTTWHCHLLKVWEGEKGKPMKLTGAVFDGKHGPQPIQLGTTKLSQSTPAWSHSSGAKLQYEGYRVNAKGATLVYRFADSKGNILAMIEETPEYTKPNLTREISITKLVSGTLQFLPPKGSSWKVSNKAAQAMKFNKPTNFQLTKEL